MIRLFRTIAGVRAELRTKGQNRQIALVPTMGALHAGHFSLIRRAVSENEIVVVSIFVNPLQFSPHEDLEQYPRQLEQDCQSCTELGVDVVFAPSATELYRHDSVTEVIPPAEMTAVLCGQSRLRHFIGVATVVTKLLHIIQPQVAYFGEKDAQQLAIIRRLVADLNLSVEIRACSIVREDSGLALSSRNQYLSDEEKVKALCLSQGLKQAELLFKTGEMKANALVAAVKQELTPVAVEYVELVHPDSLKPLEQIETAGLLAIAARVGSTRLIDNVILRHRQPIITIDGPAGAGKSTVTRRVAQELGLLYLDTGAMYRGVTWLVMRSGIPLTDEAAIAELTTQMQLELLPGKTPAIPTRISIDGEDATAAIRTPEVTANVSAIAAQAAVREILVKLQQKWGEKGGIIAEGRDMGTCVFPHAEVKIFLTASVQERARRRLQDFQEQGKGTVNLEQLEQDIQSRDYLDSTRSISPLKPAPDAIEISTDGLTIEQVTQKIIYLYQQLIINYLE